MTDQLSLIDMLPKAEGCVTCHAVRPANYQGLWLEPVSGECHDCNGKTLHEIMYGPDRDAAWLRHHRHVTGKRSKVRSRGTE